MNKFRLEDDQKEMELNKREQEEPDCHSQDVPSMSRNKKKKSVFGALGEFIKELVYAEETMHKLQVTDCMMGTSASPPLRIDDVETAGGATPTQDPRSRPIKEQSPLQGDKDLHKETITDPAIVTSLPVVQ